MEPFFVVALFTMTKPEKLFRGAVKHFFLLSFCLLAHFSFKISNIFTVNLIGTDNDQFFRSFLLAQVIYSFYCYILSIVFFFFFTFIVEDSSIFSYMCDNYQVSEVSPTHCVVEISKSTRDL